MELSLHFTVRRIAAVEAYLGKPLVDILDELRDDKGASLRTLHALADVGAQPAVGGFHDLIGAIGGLQDYGTKLIEEHGIAAVSEAVGTGLSAFLATINKPVKV